MDDEELPMQSPYYPYPAPSSHESLLRVIRSVRNRWRFRIVVRGVAVVLSAGLGLLLLSSLGMDQFRFSPASVAVFRVIAYGTLIAVTVRFLVMPLVRRVSDEEVALYLEEHEPSLRGELVSAIEFGGEGGGSRRGGNSPALVEKLVQRAVERCTGIDGGRRIERPRLARSSGMLAGATLMGVAVLLVQPGFVRHAAPFLLSPWSGAEAGSPYWIEVEPGDASVARSADLKVTVRLRGFDADDVEIVLRRGVESEWDRWSMTVDEEVGGYGFVVFSLDDVTEYFVEAGGVRSQQFTIDVTDLPYVQRIDLEYHFPEYTRLSPITEQDGGDIAALIGTRVVVTVMPTLPVAGGALVIDERDTITLEAMSGAALAATLTVQRDGLYRIVFRTADGSNVVGSPEYYIDALADQPPVVSFRKPGRDLKVTSVDEVFVETRAEDDFGVARLELSYSVNGGAEQTVALYGPGAMKEITAGHTLYLEELGLQPGDLVSYFARATDANRIGGTQTTATDIYFLEVRPFDLRYRRADARGGGGGGDDVGELSLRQRQIVAATFKLVRDSTEYSASELRENLATLALAQGRLREEVGRLVQRIRSRRVAEIDSAFQAVARALSSAVEHMGSAEELLGERRPKAALPPEQRALQQLQRAEAVYRERQVSMGGRGAGAGGQASAEDLADLFELELDKLRNQYEQVQRGERQQVDQQLDEALEKLRELARRQQQETERMRARAQNLAAPAPGGGRSQRRLAQESETLARQLERLAREQSRPELEATARRLQEAADAMRRAAAQGRNGAAQGSSALQRLREARRLLERDRSQGLMRQVEDALQRAERLAEQQRDVVNDVERLGRDPAAERGRLGRLIDRKNEMTNEVRDLEGDINRLSRQARRDQPKAAQKLQEAVNGLRDSRLADKILYSRGVVQGRSREYARNFEQQIGADIAELERRLREAAGAIGESREQRLGRALDRARELASALESLEQRVRERQRGQSGQEGQGVRRLSRDEERQFQRELAERLGELQELRRELVREGVDVSPLDGMIRALGRLANRDLISVPGSLQELAARVIPGLKEFEYALRRQLEGADAEQIFLSGSDDVPVEYRALVEEYYRSLSRKRH